jgi:hypothetical protein
MMAWLRNRAGRQAPAAAGERAPTSLPVTFDEPLFKRQFAQLVAAAEQDGGIEGYLAALSAKQRCFAAALAQVHASPLAKADIAVLLQSVFTARRRLGPAFEVLGGARVGALIGGLLQETGPLSRRLQNFVDAMPGAADSERESMRAAAKVRRAAWDFAAEVVHFSDPARHPLMSRWVWDRATQSGALREFICGGDAMPEIPIPNNGEAFEAAREWMASCLVEEGIYRDVPLWIDLMLAHAYTGYLRAMTEGGLGADFARGTPPQEQLKKLLGIDGRAVDAGAGFRGFQHADT